MTTVLTAPKVKSIYDLQDEYRTYCRKSDSTALDLSLWLPGLSCIRPIMPGEFLVIMADTGVGKTAIAQNIAVSARPFDVLLCEMELPGTLCFERFTAMGNDVTQEAVEQIYKDEESLRVGMLDHIFTCDKSGLKLTDIPILCESCRLDGNEIGVVIVDYIGLLDCDRGRNRYERMSAAAEQLKVLAKDLDVVMIATTQIHRKGEGYQAEVSLHDAKDSGSIENSAGVLLGVWRDEEDSGVLHIKVLKNTKGQPGRDILADFDGAKMAIRPQRVDPWPNDID